VLGCLLGANVLVFGAWQFLDLRRHFTVSSSALEDGRLHTLLTSAFSHADGWHLAGNMLSLYFFGREVGLLFGGRYLAALYVAGGVTASLAHVLWERRSAPSLPYSWARIERPALGASGAVNAIVLFDALLFPTRLIYVNFIFPVPAILLAGGVLLRDVYGANGSGDGVAHAGHIGGAACGFAAFAWLKLKGRARGGWR
jgi:membrane associated rhomboid family serine protease